MDNKNENFDEKLRDALLCRCLRRQNEYVDEVEARWLVNRKDTFSYENKKFSDLLNELNNWLVDIRPDVLEEFNDPVEQAQFDNFERESGLILPEEYKLLLAWRGGQRSHFEECLDPFAEETLMSLDATMKTRQCLNGLVEAIGLPEQHWDSNWLPFMADCFGNNTCIDLSPETYGEVLLFDHEIGGRIVLCENMTAWLAELVDKLQFLANDLNDLEESECVD